LNSGVVPEDGVCGYEVDHTQGPSCALACAAATVWRNYFVPMTDPTSTDVAMARGQTRDRQLNNLAGVQALLGTGVLGMTNGYSSCADIEALSARVNAMSETERDQLRAALRVGVQVDAQVTDVPADAAAVRVTQVFCSALAVGSSSKLRLWRPLAQLILEASYEAVLAVAAYQLHLGGSRNVYMTLLGGGAFGNGPKWIEEALRRALALYAHSSLRVVIVHRSDRSPWMQSYLRLGAGFGSVGFLRLTQGKWVSGRASDDEDGEDEEEHEAGARDWSGVKC